MHHHYIEDGVFEERRNQKEAEQIAKQVADAIKRDKHVGVVAFSEEQLNCIWEQLNTSTRELLQEKLDTNEAFFKALENVQGDECDQLFISFGYGRNNDGEFHLRFGPMNRTSGRKRLNVLLTRARESIHFFCSVKSTEFKLSDNESINLLRMWLQFSENHKDDSKLTFPYNLEPRVEGNKLIIRKVQNSFNSAQELVTLQSVLEERGWEVEYE